MSPRERLSYVARAVGLAVLYAVVARMGLTLDAVGGFATLVWPPTGIALAALLVFGYRMWPGVALGAFLVNWWTGASAIVSLGIGAGNTLEALLGAYALRRFVRFRVPLYRLRHVVGLIFLAALMSTTVSAGFGVASLHLGGVVASDHLAETFRAWWLGDVLGNLVVAPLLLAWYGTSLASVKPIRIAEAIALGASMVAVGLFVFFGSAPKGSSTLREAYLVFPVLIWAALRFGLRGATATLFAMSAIAVWGTAAGHGPFAQEALHLGLLSLQAFMAVAAATTLILGAASSERADDMRRREEFLAIVSHDLRSPLAAIQMSASLLQTRAQGGEAAVRSHLSIVGRSVERMNSLIRDLLDSAVIDAGSLSLTLEEQDVGRLVNESVELSRPLALQKSQTIEVALPSARVVAQLDRERLLQVLGNLIGNAIKFTPDGATITVSVAISVGTVEVQVHDNGPGIEPQQLRHAFDRFWQAKPGARMGAGLGLSIVKGIVEAHGGKVWARSKLGAGSTFHFTIPKASRRVW